MELVTAVVCVLAALALGYRLVSTWDTAGTLVHTLGLLLICSVLVAAVVVAAAPAHDTTAQLLGLVAITCHGLVCLVVAAGWPVLQFRFTIPISGIRALRQYQP